MLKVLPCTHGMDPFLKLYNNYYVVYSSVVYSKENFEYMVNLSLLKYVTRMMGFSPPSHRSIYCWDGLAGGQSTVVRLTKKRHNSSDRFKKLQLQSEKRL